jgi:hypothetical protein
MEPALQLCDTAADALCAVEVAGLTPQALAVAVVRVQRVIDRLTLAHARLVAEADRAGVWGGSGARNMADWLAGQTCTSYREAVGRVQLGDTFGSVPELAEAVNAGEVSAATALALHDAVAAAPAGADVGGLVEAVKRTGPREAKAAAQRWTELNSAQPESEEEREERRYRRRSVRSAAPVDGMVTTTVVLPLLQSRRFINAISQAAGTPSEGDDRTNEQRLADGLVLLCDAYSKGEVKGGRERPTVLLVFDAEAYAGDSDTAAHTANGDRIPAHVARLFAENAHLQRVLRIGSKILDLGREVRFATGDHYRALVVRDGGCRWPGCHIPAAWCEIDHLVPFQSGGSSHLANLVMWCSHHHHEKHRPGVEVLGDASSLRLRLVTGQVIDCPPRGDRSPADRPAAAAA